MSNTSVFATPYFDPKALRVELTGLFRASGDNAVESRPMILDRLKSLVKDSRDQARLTLEADGKGRQCAEGLSHFQDELIRLLYD